MSDDLNPPAKTPQPPPPPAWPPAPAAAPPIERAIEAPTPAAPPAGSLSAPTGPDPTAIKRLFDRVTGEIAKIYVGQDEFVLTTMVALFSGGHVLIESVPGLGKTLFVRALGRVLGCQFGRIQFTADLMPSDITGAPIFDMKTQEFRFRPGPVFTQFLLADEINRSPAKTHAALLEIMQEYRVTVERTSHKLKRPFLVLATQNPIESEGTYNLPEAQLDRFMFKIVANYPSTVEEVEILKQHSRQLDLDKRLTEELAAVTGPDEIMDVMHRTAQIRVDDKLFDYINRIVRLTREWSQFHLGASPRAGIALVQGARTLAAFRGRDYAVPDDVVEIARPALRHRVILSAEAEVEGHRVDDVLGDLIRSVEVPRLVNPLLIILALIVPLVGLGFFFGTYPRRPLILAVLAPAVFSLGLLVTDAVLAPLVVADLVVSLIAAADLFTLARRRTFEIERESGRIASLRQMHPVQLTVSNHSQRAWHVDVRDDLPTGLSADPDRFDVYLAPASRSTVNYQLQAARRGAFEQQQTYLRVASRLGLWQRSLRYAVKSRLHVYPDMQQLAEYAVLARADRLNLLGVRRTRRVGQDNEFERLRDYTRDDNYRFIDWRSTARRQKLTVKDFQANQSQRVVFLIDCGRMMSNTASGLSLLDHALNAMLMLSFVALRQSDAVGMLAFSDGIHNYVPPRSGMQQMNRLLHASFDRFPRLVESRYDEAFLYLASHARKRSLVILITNLIDEVNSHQVEQYLTNLVGRHLPLCVLLRDHQLFDAADAPAAGDPAFYRAAAAAEILTWRRQVLADLTSKGVLSLDIFPEQLTAPLVNRYLEIKARHLL